jgi:ADP-ribose pyrophosphatase
VSDCEFPTLVDLAAAAEVSESTTMGRGYLRYERYRISLRGNPARDIERDLLHSGRVVGILPIDIGRDEVVLIRQFRLAGHIMLGKGAMIEIPAGRVESQETASEAARRECHEEIGAWPCQIQPLFTIMPAPALSDELMTLFAARIDAAKVKARAGRPEEQEDIEPLRVPIDAALDMVRRGGVHNGAAITALQWLALNRHALPALFASAAS